MNRLSESGLWPATEVKLRPIAELKPSPRNARLHSERQLDQIRASLRDYGWTTAVLVDEEGQIIAGHGRVEAAKREGLTEVPVAVATGWTEAQRRAYALADNRIPLNASWDEAALGVELAELTGLGVDLGTLGFNDQEVGGFTNPGTPGHCILFRGQRRTEKVSWNVKAVVWRRRLEANLKAVFARRYGCIWVHPSGAGSAAGV